jgi:hypothetical protein
VDPYLRPRDGLIISSPSGLATYYDNIYIYCEHESSERAFDVKQIKHGIFTLNHYSFDLNQQEIDDPPSGGGGLGTRFCTMGIKLFVNLPKSAVNMS